MRWKPRLRTVLLIVNLVIFLLPLGGIAVLRLYENELIRRTEAQLVAQGAFVSAQYRQALTERLADSDDPELAAGYGEPVAPGFRVREELQPIRPQLDIAVDEIRDPAPEPATPDQPADGDAVAAGQRIMPVMHEAKNITLAGIRVVDYRGVVVGSTRGELGLSLAHREEVWRGLRGERVSLMRARISDEPEPPLASISRGSRVRVFVCLPVVEGERVIGAVVLSRTPQDVRKGLYLNRVHLAGGALFLLLVVLLMSIFTSLTISQPVAKLIAQIDKLKRGEMGAAEELARPGTHEVALLSRAFTDMARTVEERTRYITTFAQNVSHEFKTPLTAIRGTVELLRDHLASMSAEERDLFLGNLDADADRLDRLVGKLLELARADTFKPDDESVELGPVIDAVVRRVSSTGLDVAMQERAVGEVAMGAETLESVVSNLVENARQHGGPDVRVEIVIDESGDGFLEVVVSDDGPGITEPKPARVFDAFFTTARARGGSGLGLSIVRSLVTAHGGTVDVDTHRQVGASFRVRLPRGSVGR